MLILPGYPQMRFAGVGGKAYNGGPVKILLHTWEGTSWTSFRNAVESYPPHLACSKYDHKFEQYVPLDLASYALLSGDTEHVIQVEMAGFAADTPNWTDDDLKWLADTVFKPILALVGPVPQVSYAFVGGEGYGKDSPFRRSQPVIHAYHGWLGHQHMFGNSHWDPGKFRIDRLLDFVYDVPIAPPAPIPQEDDMAGPFEEFSALQDIVIEWYVRIDGRDEADIDAGGFDYWTGRLAAAVVAAAGDPVKQLSAIASEQHFFASLVANAAGLQAASGAENHPDPGE